MLKLLYLFLLVLVAASHAEEPPNIVFILADDLGYGDIGAYNPESRITTPHLDRLAAEGMIFMDAHSGGSTCKPSRYSLFSGNFSVRAESLNDKQGPMLPEGRPTLASILRDNGYRTAMVGKWHLGFDQRARPAGASIEGFAFDYDRPLTGGPMDRGFDSFFGMHASLDIQPYFYIQGREQVLAPTETVEASTSVGGEEDWRKIQGAFWRDGAISPDFKHIEVTPRFTDAACRVIENHEGEQPLFLYLALPSPHTPWLPTEEFAGSSAAGMYGDFVMQVDAVVGQVLASLDEAGLSEETLVLFSSDNGPVWYDKDVERFGHRATGPLRGDKASVWEGGHRVPFLIRWPGQVDAGTTNDYTLAFAYVFATFAELAGQTDLPEGAAIDSVSFASTLLHPDEEHVPRPAILHGERVIRSGEWKLIATKGGRGHAADPDVSYGIELYNLEEDLSEENNLAESMPEMVDSLRATIQRTVSP